jgi:hypothetical protein
MWITESSTDWSFLAVSQGLATMLISFALRASRVLPSSEANGGVRSHHGFPVAPWPLLSISPGLKRACLNATATRLAKALDA